MKNALFGFIFLIGFIAISPGTYAENEKATDDEISVEFPEIVVEGISHDILITSDDKKLKKTTVVMNGKEIKVNLTNGTGVVSVKLKEETTVRLTAGGNEFSKNIHPIPLWLSLIPPLIAIFMALAFKEVVSSLFLGLFIGSAIIHIYAEGLWEGIVFGFLSVIDTYIIGSLNDAGHLSVIVFSLLIGATVTVISRNGGMQGIVNIISRFAHNAQSGQFATWFLGIAIFFDDYANTLVVGNTMRPVTDKLRISREKLSYLVDSTAAPIAAVAFVTTWIGAELGYIQDGISSIDDISGKENVYSIFMNSLQYSFYPLFTLIFIFMLVWKKRDFGPMFKAEERARFTGQVSSTLDDEKEESEELKSLEPVSGTKPKWYNAAIPVLTIILGTIGGLIYTGLANTADISPSVSLGKKASLIIGNADSYAALLWASMAGLAVAIGLTVGQRIMSLSSTISSAVNGFKTMLSAIMILVLAWALAAITKDLHTADFLTLLLSDNIAPFLIPAITFILAALVAFSTGSSWGTMAILYPLMLPAAWKICQEAGYDYQESINIFYNVVSCVLAGSVLGDHCSPISDTTILSSLATSCHHIDHVRTQLPYALTVGVTAIFFGTIPAALNVPFWITFPAGLIILFLIIYYFGKDAEAEQPELFEHTKDE